MPNTTSAKKALRQNITRRLQNRSQRTALRTVIKKCRLAAVSGDAYELLFAAPPSADAALAASLFHFGELTVPDLKKYLEGRGVAVRPARKP